MTKYELLYIISADYTDDEVVGVQKQVVELIEKEEGKISRNESLGKIKLAYPIKKSKHGTYILVHFESEQASIQPLDRILRLTDEVLRHQIIIMPAGAEDAKVEINSYVAPLTDEGKKPRQPRQPSVPVAKPISVPAPTPEPTPIAPPTPVVVDETQSMSMEELDKKLDEILEKDITIDS